MQNKPNLLDTQMNVTSAHITSYQLPVTNYQYAKQTQSNPTRSELVEPILPAVAPAKAGKAKVMLKGKVSNYTIGLYEKVFTE